MGQENSRFEDDDGERSSPLQRDRSSAPATSSPHASSPSASKPKKVVGSNAQQWMRVNSHPYSSPAEVRKTKIPSPANRYKSTPNDARLETAMSQLLNGAKPQQLTSEEKRMEMRKELVGKLNNFVSRAPPKLTPEMAQPARAAIVPDQFRAPERVQKDWIGKLANSKAEALQARKNRVITEPWCEPMTQEQVGGKVEASLGDTYETFAGFQGEVNSFLERGLTEEALEPFLFDEEAERTLTTYEKWQVVRNAAEQVLQVYANRANAIWIEEEQWKAPNIIDVNAAAASVYSGSVDAALSQGHIALLFIDDGRLCEVGPDAQVAPLLSSDLWQAIKDLAPHKVPSGQRLERLSVMGRHLLQAALSIEMWYGITALRALKIVVAIDADQEHFLVSEIQQWSYFGLFPNNIVVLPLPRFHGFAQEPSTGRLAHVKGSAQLMLGTGYAMFLLNSPAEAYQLTVDFQPLVLDTTVLEWLRENKASWLFSGLFSDIERLRPDAMVDADFLSAAMYAVDRTGANMAMEVVHGNSERDARMYDSIVLGRGSTGKGESSCNLRASAMRTVKSYQVLNSHINNSQGFHIATHRYAFKISALQRLLVDPTAFHADVRLFGFYAYAVFDLGDITTFAGSKCAAILGSGNKGPPMSDVVYGKPWLVYAAGVLEAQDKVNEFRQKAIKLIAHDKLGATQGAGGVQVTTPMGSTARPTSAFKERKSGFTVLMLLLPEHAKLSKTALRLSRLFLHNIVDRLQITVIGTCQDSRDALKAMLDELTDKELDFNQQIRRDIFIRQQDAALVDVVRECVTSSGAKMVVVPSHRLCNVAHLQDLGNLASSLALCVIKNVSEMPVLVVKGNTLGKWAFPTATAAAQAEQGRTLPRVSNSGGRIRYSDSGREGGGPALREFMSVMCHLDSTHVAPMIESVSSHMVPSQGDILFLAKTQAFERPGQLAMRSRRVFVQARMAVANNLRVEERAYLHNAVQELPKAVETETPDMLVLSVNGEMPISKEVEDLLKLVKTSVYIYRNKDVAGPQHAQLAQFTIEEKQPERRPYTATARG